MTAAALFRRPPAPDAAAGSDRDLLRRFADGRDDAFAALVHRYGRLVFAACLRVLGHRADAEDAYQACFLVLARRAGSIRSDEKLAGWLHTVAVRTATEVRRMRARAHAAPSLTLPAPTEPPRDAAEQAELAAALDEELAKLPDHYRLAVVLCELSGVSRRDAAKELGVAEGTLSSRLAKARKLLAERLAGRGFAGASAVAITAAVAASAVAKIPATPLDFVRAISKINCTVVSVAETVVKAMYATKLKAGAVLAVLLALTGGMAWTTAAGAGGQPGASPAPAKDDRPALVARTQLLDQFVAAFREDTEHKAKFDHPVWKRWAKVIGDDRPARELFAQMLLVPDAAKLLDQLEAKPDTAADVYRTEAVKLLRLAEKRGKPRRLGPSSAYSAGENTFVAYLGTFPGTEKVFTGDDVDAERWPLGNLTHQHLWSLGPVVLDPATGGIVLRAPRTPDELAVSGRIEAPSRKLFLASLANRKHEETIEYGLSSWNADPKAILPFAKAVLADNMLPARVRAATFVPFLRANAVECDADIAAFEKDETVLLESVSHRDGKNDNLQVRDVAVAVRLQLRKQMLADFGFVRAVPPKGPEGRFDFWQHSTVYMTFPDEKARAAAHEKALAFLKDAPKLKAPEPKPEPPKKQEPAEPLVKLLSSRDFAEREAAEKALRELGPTALPAVTAGLKSDNPEVVARCRKLIGTIHRDLREAFAKDFLADKGQTKSFDHPVWKRYVEIAGDSKAGRTVFAELLKYNAPDGLETLDRADRDPAKADELYREHLYAAGDRVRELSKYSFSIRDLVPGHDTPIAAFTLFLGSMRTTATDPEKLPVDDRVRYVNGRNTILQFGDGVKEGLKGNLMVMSGPQVPKGQLRAAVPGPPGTDTVFARLFTALLRHDSWPAELVKELGAKDFAEREAAQQKLKALGAAAYDAVTAGLKSDSPEVVVRCKKLLPDVRAAWLARPDSDVWKRFAAIAGDTPHAKELFVEMAADPDRAARLAADTPAKEYAAVVERTLKALREKYAALMQERRTTGLDWVSELVPATQGDTVLLLFLGSALETAATAPKIEDRDRILWHNHLNEAFMAGKPSGRPFPPEVRRLFAAWLGGRKDQQDVRAGLSFARFHKFAEVLPVARAMLADDRRTTAERTPALYALAQLGTKDDVKSVVPFLDSDAVYHRTKYTHTDGKQFPVTTEVRDVAHAAAGKLLGADLADLGFEFCKKGEPDDGLTFRYDHFAGFTTDAKRAAAHAKVKALLAKAPVPKDVGPPKPKKLPRAADLPAELRTEFAGPSVLCTAEMVGKLEARAVELAKKFPAAEDRARVYQHTAKAIANGRLREDHGRVKALAEMALSLSRDPVTRWKARSLIASTIYIGDGTALEKRRQQAEVLLAGYVELLGQDLPDADPEWPAMRKLRLPPDGPDDDPAERARILAERAAQEKARAEVEFTKELVFGRTVLLMQLRDLFKPDAADELRKLAAKKMTDGEVKTLLARVFGEK